MTKAQLKKAMNFREVEVWSPHCGDWIRVDKEFFGEWLEDRSLQVQFKAQVIGFVVRIG
jgi:hypothetical protein